MRNIILASVVLSIVGFGHPLRAQELYISEVVSAQADYDESQTETRRAALLQALANYQGEATVETVNAHLIVMSYDAAGGNYKKLRESAVAASTHLAPVAEIVPRQYIDAKFVAAMALFNGDQEASAMIEMAHVEGFTRSYRDEGAEDRPEWATNLYWKAAAWNMAMDAYFESVDEDHPSEEEIQAILANYKADTETLNASARESDEESGLPFCDGRIVQSPKLRYPARAARKGMVGAVFIGLDLDPDGNVLNPTVLASIPSEEFDDSLLRTVSKWRYRPAKRKDVGVTCKLERSDIVLPFIFTLPP